MKVDWNPNDVPTTKRIRKALDESGKDIVLSLSNAAPYEHVEELGKLANLWRTTGDIQDHWGSVSGIGFPRNAGRSICARDIGMTRTFSRSGSWESPTSLTPHLSRRD